MSSVEFDDLGGFVSFFEHSLDAKKRLTIPSHWREIIGVPHRVFIMPGISSRCLMVYPAREMSQRMERLRKLSISDERGRRVARMLGSRSDLAPWDSAGRIRIKDDLLEHAALTTEVALVGTFDGFELWNPENWRAQESDPEAPDFKASVKYVGF